jgi:hypothetical protein
MPGSRKVESGQKNRRCADYFTALAELFLDHREPQREETYSVTLHHGSR